MESKVGKLNYFFFSKFFFQPQNWPPSLGSLLWPWRPRKAVVKTFCFFGFPTQKMLEYHWVLLKPHVNFFLSSTSHSWFLEHWNSKKSVCNIWQRFPCLLDEGIPKICKKLNSHDGFLSYLLNSTANSAHLAAHFCPALVCPQKAIVIIQFLAYFWNLLIKLTWKMLSNAGKNFLLFHHFRNIPCPAMAILGLIIHFFVFY